MKKKLPVTVDAPEWTEQKATIAEQERLGLRRQAAPVHYVPPVQQARQEVMSAQQIAALNASSHVIDVAPTATTHVEHRTSAVDRAKGFLLASVPLFATVALLAVLVAWIAFDTPLLSVGTLLIFWVTFAATWAGAWWHTLSMSPEGIALSEAKEKWRIVGREQEHRWAYYERITNQKGDE